MCTAHAMTQKPDTQTDTSKQTLQDERTFQETETETVSFPGRAEAHPPICAGQQRAAESRLMIELHRPKLIA